MGAVFQHAGKHFQYLVTHYWRKNKKQQHVINKVSPISGPDVNNHRMCACLFVLSLLFQRNLSHISSIRVLLSKGYRAYVSPHQVLIHSLVI